MLAFILVTKDRLLILVVMLLQYAIVHWRIFNHLFTSRLHIILKNIHETVVSQ